MPSCSFLAAQIANRPEPIDMFFVSNGKTSSRSSSDAASRIVLNVPDRPLEIVTAMTFLNPSSASFSNSSVTSAIEGVEVDGNSSGNLL